MIPWQLFASLVGGGIKDYFTKKGQIASIKAEAQASRAANGIPGYSDEYLVFVWSYPAVASFVPALQPSVQAGFEFMATMPEWYVGGFMTVSAAVFGLDKLLRYKIK